MSKFLIQTNFIMKTVVEDLNYRPAILKDRKDDLSKEWYIEFYIKTFPSKEWRRKRIKIPVKYQNAKSRREFAKKEVIKINTLLSKGYLVSDKDVLQIENHVDTLVKTKLLFESLYDQINISSHLRLQSVKTYKSVINSFKRFYTEEQHKVKPSTFENFVFTDVPIESLTPGIIYRLRDFFVKSGNLPVTANKKIEHLSHIYRQILQRNELKIDPFKNIRPLVETEISISNLAFTKEDQLILENYLNDHDPELFAFTRYMYYAFVRPKELRSVKFSCIDSVNRIITVGGEISKNRKTRSIYIINPLIPFIPKASYPIDDYVFGKKLKPGRIQLSENTAYNRHKQALLNCGLVKRNYTLYSWRHTGAVNAYLSGIGIKELQSMFGHATMEQTSTYLKSLSLVPEFKMVNYNW